MCPECRRKMPRSPHPLVCSSCNQRFHLKCAKETRDALKRLRTTNTWVCHLCTSAILPASTPTATTVRSTVMPTQRADHINILQWNCDGLATKANELKQLIQRRAVDVVLIQETKLGRDDTTPCLPGFNYLRRDRPGSGANLRRGGGLAIYIRQGLPYTETSALQGTPLELQSIRIPLARREDLKIINAYLPPENSTSINADELRRILSEVETRGNFIVCGDLNAHHYSWDTMARETPRRKALHEWFRSNS